MGLRIVQLVNMSMIFIAVMGCAPFQQGTNKSVSPAENAKREVFRYDCCNPGLSSGTKEMCDLASTAKNHVLVDQDKNRYEFIWSDCKIGKEPWRKFEDPK